MVLGADGRIYCTGEFRDGNRTFVGMIRYRLEGNAPVFDAKLAADGIRRRGIAFARNGDMLVCEGNTIQAYTTEGARLGRGFNYALAVKTPYFIYAGKSVLTENDEVFFREHESWHLAHPLRWECLLTYSRGRRRTVPQNGHHVPHLE
jgi:hypothetical protein